MPSWRPNISSLSRNTKRIYLNRENKSQSQLEKWLLSQWVCQSEVRSSESDEQWAYMLASQKAHQSEATESDKQQEHHLMSDHLRHANSTATESLQE